jgi:hypothetical protein
MGVEQERHWRGMRQRHNADADKHKYPHPVLYSREFGAIASP